MTSRSPSTAGGLPAPSPNNEFVMDVIRGSTCTDSPTGGATKITSYDWCVNGSGTTSW